MLHKHMKKKLAQWSFLSGLSLNKHKTQFGAIVVKLEK